MWSRLTEMKLEFYIDYQGRFYRPVLLSKTFAPIFLKEYIFPIDIYHFYVYTVLIE